jgi:hypothetical protein
MGGNPYKKADQAKKKAPGAKQKAAEAKIEETAAEIAEEKKTQEEPLKSEIEASKVEKPAAKPAAKAEPKAKEKLDIFAKLNTEKPTAKNVTFYLSGDNITKLKKMAEKKGVSTSKLLDHILSEVL